MIGGIISLTIGVIFLVNVFIVTVKGANTTGWSAGEIAILGSLTLVGLGGMAYGVAAVFGVI
jgi:hypothetical protein